MARYESAETAVQTTAALVERGREGGHPCVGLPCEQRRLRDYLVTPHDSFPTDGKRVAEEIKALVENRQTASEVRKKLIRSGAAGFQKKLQSQKKTKKKPAASPPSGRTGGITPIGARTRGHEIKSPALYQLSYGGTSPVTGDFQYLNPVNATDLTKPCGLHCHFPNTVRQLRGRDTMCSVDTLPCGSHHPCPPS
jgi:hypothetical protein